MRGFAVVGLILCTCYQQSAIATPTKCGGQQLHAVDWVQKYFDTADAVFLGKVVAEETPDPPKRPASKAANSMKELLDQIEAGQDQIPPPPRYQTAKFEIAKSWKGEVGPQIFARSQVSNRTINGPFTVGESYLVFGYMGDDIEVFFVPEYCASAQQWTETAARIRVLDALTRLPGAT